MERRPRSVSLVPGNQFEVCKEIDLFRASEVGPPRSPTSVHEPGLFERELWLPKAHNLDSDLNCEADSNENASTTTRDYDADWDRAVSSDSASALSTMAVDFDCEGRRLDTLSPVGKPVSQHHATTPASPLSPSNFRRRNINIDTRCPAQGTTSPRWLLHIRFNTTTYHDCLAQH